jgi:hypothetical protein
MKRVMIVLASLAGVAHAGSAKPPPGWQGDPELAVKLSRELGEVRHFGGLPAIVTTEVYRSPEDRAGVLYVTRLVANVTPERRDVAASAQLDELRRSEGRKLAWTRRALDDRQLEAALTWRDPSSGVVTESRMLVAADAQHLVSVTGECVLAPDAPEAVGTACRAALATLDPMIEPAARIDLRLLPESAPPAGVSVPDPATTLEPPPDRTRPAFEPITVPATREADRRPIYVGFGLVVLAAVFWWNRRRRERFEREHEGDRPGRRPRRDADADADDLRAAASGDDPGERGTKEEENQA